MPRKGVLTLLLVTVAGCRSAPAAVAPQLVQATQPNAPPQAVAPDSVARRELADVHQVVPGARIELRYATTSNFTGAVLPGYGAARPLLRREAAVALARVERDLEAHGYALKIWDAYRPVRATLAMVAWCEAHGRTDLLDDGYIARRSRHNQGVAIDLTVVDRADGRELDMGTPFDNFTPRAHTANATGAEAAHRALLGDAMRRAGFVNYVDEWWHFTYEVRDPVPFDLALEQW